MFRFLINIARFRLGRRAGKKLAKSMGMRWLAKPIGVLSGIKATR